MGIINLENLVAFKVSLRHKSIKSKRILSDFEKNIFELVLKAIRKHSRNFQKPSEVNQRAFADYVRDVRTGLDIIKECCREKFRSTN